MRNVAAAVAVVVVILLASDSAARASTSATGAVVVSDLGRYDAGRDVAVTPDGDVVVAACTHQRAGPSIRRATSSWPACLRAAEQTREMPEWPQWTSTAFVHA